MAAFLMTIGLTIGIVGIANSWADVVTMGICKFIGL